MMAGERRTRSGAFCTGCSATRRQPLVTIRTRLPSAMVREASGSRSEGFEAGASGFLIRCVFSTRAGLHAVPARAGFRLKTLQGASMAKSRISATDLIWIFKERMQAFEDCASGISLAIVPSKEGWSVVMNAHGRNDNPRCAKRIQQLESQLASPTPSPGTELISRFGSGGDGPPGPRTSKGSACSRWSVFSWSWWSRCSRTRSSGRAPGCSPPW